MYKQDNLLFQGLKIVSWIIFVGLSIEAGAVIVNFIFSLVKPEFVSHLYQKLDLSEIHARSGWAFYGMYSFVVSIAVLKAVMFYWVVMLVSKIDLSNPFNESVSKHISQISYYAFSIGIISYVATESARNLNYQGFDTDVLHEFWVDAQAFILMAAVIYIISVIFRKGVALQAENELTV